jgi:putative ABC transport system permease protein
MPLVEETLVGLNDRRVVERLRTLSDIKDRSYRGDRAMAILLGTVIGLLIAITALGIVGLASYIIKQRTKQIGTRRAIGARKIDIIRYFLVENWLMTTMGVIVGTALTLGLNYWLVTEFELTRLDLLYVPAGIFVLWGLGLLAVLGPARRAAAIEPAIATRTV